MPSSILRNKNRVGLVGFNCATGNGIQNYQILKYGGIDSWLIIPHKRYGVRPSPDGISTFIRRSRQDEDDFLETVDTIVFVETPFYEGMLNKAKERGKRAVCVPNQEWLPRKLRSWCSQVDLFLCPTQHCFDIVEDHLPAVLFPWPFETSRYQFQQRERCERFLFLNGRGGVHGRKGIQTVSKAKKVWKEMPVITYSQRRDKYENLELLPPKEDNRDLYQEGDVLLLPHRVDGLGLEMLEAMSTGMPVISTNGLPWNEFPALHRIASIAGRKQLSRLTRTVDWYFPSPKDLANACERWHHQDIREESLQCRQFAEERSWDKKAKQFRDLTRGEYE